MRRTLSRRHGLALLLAAPAAGLGGCNLRPLYGKNEASLDASLQATRILPLSDRLGQKLHNPLRERINPFGQPSNPVYNLAVDLTRTETESGIREDETATRITLTFSADYRLVTVEGKQTVAYGTTGAQAAYNILENRYSTLVSQQAAEERALVIIADAITARLGAALG